MRSSRLPIRSTTCCLTCKPPGKSANNSDVHSRPSNKPFMTSNWQTGREDLSNSIEQAPRLILCSPKLLKIPHIIDQPEQRQSQTHEIDKLSLLFCAQSKIAEIIYQSQITFRVQHKMAEKVYQSQITFRAQRKMAEKFINLK